MDGVDDEWIDAGSRRRVGYSNLGAGDYVFRVRAKDRALNETAEPFEWRFTVDATPPRPVVAPLRRRLKQRAEGFPRSLWRIWKDS